MRVGWLTLASLLALPACQWIGDFEDFKGGAGQGGGAGQAGEAGAAGSGPAGQGGAAGGASGEAGQAGAAISCGEPPKTRDGKEMVGVARKSVGKCFWIDKTEVTRGEYGQFLSSGERPKTDLLHCDTGAKPSTQPSSDCVDKLPSLDPSAASALPQTCVDWCDAHLYCLWAGKALCGGPEDQAKSLDTSLWYAACTGDGANGYCYEGEYDPGKCNVSDGCGATPCQLQPASSFPSCKSRDGALSMSGNAAEWTAECGSFAPQKACNVRGGSISIEGVLTKCESSSGQLPAHFDPFLGFRCCLSP